MYFVVIELQRWNDGTVANIVSTYPDRANAENQYHSVLAAAAVSSVPCHSAIMLNGDGVFIKSERYYHGGEESTEE